MEGRRELYTKVAHIGKLHKSVVVINMNDTPHTMYRPRAFRIHLTHSQARIISKIIGAQRFSYNWAVERLQTDPTKTRFDLCTEFTAAGDAVAAGNGAHMPKHRHTSGTRRCGHIQQVWERQPKVPLQETYTCHIMRHTATIHGQPYRVIAGAWHGQAARLAAIPIPA